MFILNSENLKLVSYKLILFHCFGHAIVNMFCRIFLWPFCVYIFYFSLLQSFQMLLTWLCDDGDFFLL